MNDYLIIETSELYWMIIDTKTKMENLISFYEKSEYEREIEEEHWWSAVHRSSGPSTILRGRHYRTADDQYQ